MTAPFVPYAPGRALAEGAAAPATPRNVPHRGGAVNPTADAVRKKFGVAVQRVDVVLGETTVVVDRA